MSRAPEPAFEIGPAVSGDAAGLAAVAAETGLFPPEALDEMIAPYLAGGTEAFWLTARDGETVLGLCFTSPEAFADGAWNMLALGVRPGLQRRGVGAALVGAAEARLRGLKARLLIVETSGLDAFAGARRFYERRGYEHEARIRDYWAPGDDKVIFRKALD